MMIACMVVCLSLNQAGSQDSTSPVRQKIFISLPICRCLQREIVREFWLSEGVQAGDVFGELEVLAIYFTGGPRSHRIAICQCSCRAVKHIVANSLTQGLTVSCRHYGLRKMKEAQMVAVHSRRVPRGYKAHLPIAGLNRALYDLFRPISLAIKFRDNFTCQLCGKPGGNLHTHHVVPKRQTLGLFVDPVNLICLCKACHLRVHDQGTRNPPNSRLSKILEQCTCWAELDRPATYQAESFRN